MADFLSSLVHEVRTPLTALRGSLGLLASETAELSPAVQELATIAVRNAAKLVNVLDDLAVYARVHRPECVVQQVDVDLSLLLEAAAERVQPVAEERQVTVEVEMTRENVRADEGMLRDAVARMIFYAVRVTPRDGTVRVSADTVAGCAVIRVADQGKPVLEDDQPSIFEPFSPIARRGVDSADRAGLDLAIAHIVAARHEGSIEYRQITGGGVIRLTLGPGRS